MTRNEKNWEMLIVESLYTLIRLDYRKFVMYKLVFLHRKNEVAITYHIQILLPARKS